MIKHLRKLLAVLISITLSLLMVQAPQILNNSFAAEYPPVPGDSLSPAPTSAADADAAAAI